MSKILRLGRTQQRDRPLQHVQREHGHAFNGTFGQLTTTVDNTRRVAPDVDLNAVRALQRDGGLLEPAARAMRRGRQGGKGRRVHTRRPFSFGLICRAFLVFEFSITGSSNWYGNSACKSLIKANYFDTLRRLIRFH